MHEQKENIDKENFKNQIKILDLKKISSFKNALEGFNNRLDHAEKKNQRTRWEVIWNDLVRGIKRKKNENQRRKPKGFMEHHKYTHCRIPEREKKG